MLDFVEQEGERRGGRTWWWCVFVAGEGPHKDLGTWRLERRAAAAAVVEPSPRETERGAGERRWGCHPHGPFFSWPVLFLGLSFSTQLFLQFCVFSLFLTWNMGNGQWNILYFIN